MKTFWKRQNNSDSNSAVARIKGSRERTNHHIREFSGKRIVIHIWVFWGWGVVLGIECRALNLLGRCSTI
jgi:hypothetical protein